MHILPYKKLTTLLITVTILLSCITTSFAQAEQIQHIVKTSSLIDNANLLTPTEAQNLLSAINEVEKKHEIRIGIVTEQRSTNVSIGKYANEILDRYYTDGVNGNIVLVINMQSRDYYISTDAKMREQIINGDGIEYLSKEFVPYLSDGNYAKAFTTFIDSVDIELSFYSENNTPMTAMNTFSKETALLAAVLALIIATLVGYALYQSMSNVSRARGADAYLKRNSFTLTNKQDVYLYTNVVRTPRPKNNKINSRDSNHGGGGGRF